MPVTFVPGIEFNFRTKIMKGVNCFALYLLMLFEYTCAAAIFV